MPPGALTGSGNDGPLSTPSGGRPTANPARVGRRVDQGGPPTRCGGPLPFPPFRPQRSLEDAFPGEPIHEEWPELRAARAAMFLIGRAVQRSILEPVWECPPAYRRVFHIRRLGFTLNASALEGRVLSWDDFGGLERYLNLLDYCASSANAAAASGATRTLPRVLSPSQFRTGGRARGARCANGQCERPSIRSSSQGLPGRLSRKKAGPGRTSLLAASRPPCRRMMRRTAGTTSSPKGQDSGTPSQQRRNRRLPVRGRTDIFPAAWPTLTASPSEIWSVNSWPNGARPARTAGCWPESYTKDSSAGAGIQAGQPVSQRAFGMRLTGLGLRRKRRGHGKHWWEGIRLASF